MCFENDKEEQSPIDEEELKSSIIQLKENRIPSHFVSLEKLFDKHDAYIRRERDKKEKTCGEFDGINIGTKDSPKMINIGKCCTLEERTKIRELLIEFKDVFSWSYEDLKNFMNGKFRHTIPLKSGASPVKQK